MREEDRLGRKVVIRTHRKYGNGAKGGGRKGETGKRGTIYQIGPDGKQTVLARNKGTTFKDLAKKLFKTGFIPRHVAINPSGATFF